MKWCGSGVFGFRVEGLGLGPGLISIGICLSSAIKGRVLEASLKRARLQV